MARRRWLEDLEEEAWNREQELFFLINSEREFSHPDDPDEGETKGDGTDRDEPGTDR